MKVYVVYKNSYQSIYAGNDICIVGVYTNLEDAKRNAEDCWNSTQSDQYDEDCMNIDDIELDKDW